MSRKMRRTTPWSTPLTRRTTRGPRKANVSSCNSPAIVAAGAKLPISTLVLHCMLSKHLRHFVHSTFWSLRPGFWFSCSFRRGVTSCLQFEEVVCPLGCYSVPNSNKINAFSFPLSSRGCAESFCQSFIECLPQGLSHIGGNKKGKFSWYLRLST